MSRKFCVLPGQKPVRIARLDGHCCIIGEELREIPADMEAEAISKGAIDETALADITRRLTGAAPAPAKGIADDVKTPPPPPADPERAEKIKQAVIEVLNAGNTDDCVADGRPKASVLESLLGFDITAAERDAAYVIVKG